MTITEQMARSMAVGTPVVYTNFIGEKYNARFERSSILENFSVVIKICGSPGVFTCLAEDVILDPAGALIRARQKRKGWT